MEEDFEYVGRYDPDMRADGWEVGDAWACMEPCNCGDWVSYDDYQRLLWIYKELKHRMEGLEK